MPQQQLMAPSRLLEAAASKLKTEKKEEDSKAVKSEPNPSPTKKLASEFEKKIKSISGDTTLIKDDGRDSKLDLDVLIQCEFGSK